MENKTKSYIDKSTWGEGSWSSEPDKEQWTDEATGLPCVAVRPSSHGSWCGYVGVAEGHPLYRQVYDDLQDIDVHGGLTYSDFGTSEFEESWINSTEDANEPEKLWWFGFDTAHAGDLTPGMREHYPFISATEEYRDLPYVKEQCRLLAKQLNSYQQQAATASN